MAFYESIYIVRPDLTTEQVEQVMGRVGEIISTNGGNILQTEMWGRRDLAYEVKKSNKGFYVFHVVEGGGNLIRELESRLTIDEDVLKYMNVKVNKPMEGATPLAVGDSEGAEEASSEGADEEGYDEDEGDDEGDE